MPLELTTEVRKVISDAAKDWGNQKISSKWRRVIDGANQKPRPDDKEPA